MRVSALGTVRVRQSIARTSEILQADTALWPPGPHLHEAHSREDHRDLQQDGVDWLAVGYVF